MGVSIDDVASRADVSTATVSRALRGLPKVSPATRAKVLEAAAELGYVPSRSAMGLATGRTKTVGVLVPFVDRWYFGHALEGIDQVLRSRGYNLLLFSLGRYRVAEQRRFTEQMVRMQIDGLVVLCMGLTPAELAELERTKMPLVAVGGPVRGCAGIHIDDFAAAVAATNHLIELGHRNIAQLRGGAEDEIDFVVPELRSDGFEAAMRAAGLPLRPEWSVDGDFTAGKGAKAAARIFDLPGEQPTAVFAGSDEMALGLMFEAGRRGIRVPQDLSVVGIDDHEFSHLADLSTIAQEPVEHGRQAAAMLLAAIEGTPAAIAQKYMPFQLLKRGSTAAFTGGAA